MDISQIIFLEVGKNKIVHPNFQKLQETNLTMHLGFESQKQDYVKNWLFAKEPLMLMA